MSPINRVFDENGNVKIPVWKQQEENFIHTSVDSKPQTTEEYYPPGWTIIVRGILQFVVIAGLVKLLLILFK